MTLRKYCKEHILASGCANVIAVYVNI